MTIDTYLKKLTLEEKALLLQGKSSWTTWPVPRLQLPSMFLSDGPHGLRKQAGSEDNLGIHASLPATCFPTAATMANSWDPALGEELGTALGQEAAASDVHVVLGPGLNIKRSPLCGRNFEYFSEDPYLAGKMAAAYIRGIQSQGVSACPKHFAANSQELRRMSCDSVVDERTLREIYLTGFEIAVKEGHPKSIMTSYNPVNGVYANENTHLLADILRGEWGFDGFVVSDWGASNDHAAGVKAGSGLEMPAPGLHAAVELVQAVKSGKIKESDLDARLKELLPVILSTTQAVDKAPKTFDADAHHALARKCAAGSIVLLDNDGILPLAEGTRVALIGDFAAEPRYQGAGSSRVNPTKIDCLKDLMDGSTLHMTGFARGYTQDTKEPDAALIAEAAETAKNADVVLLCIGLDDRTEAEGTDRENMSLPASHTALLEAVRAVNPNIVLVLSGGSPFTMPPKTAYRAAIHGYLGGQAGAGAMLDAITGKAEPAGRLAETWPEALADCPSTPYYPGKERTAEYREGLYVGYRYYDTQKTAVRYPFGYGLSYTTFAYSGMTCDSRGVTFTLTNTGSRYGSEVAQVYIGRRGSGVFRPKKELKGFAKVTLVPGESRTVTIPLDDKAFRYFNVKTGRWESEPGNYDVYLAANVSDVKLTGMVRILGQEAPAPYGSLPSYESGDIRAVSDAEFEALLGRPIPESHWGGDLGRNDTVTQLEYAPSAVGRLVHRIVKGRMEKNPEDLGLVMAYNMPLRGAAHFSGGMLTQPMVDDLVHLFNGHFWSGLGRFIRDFFRSRSEIRAFQKRLDEGPEDR